MLPIRTANAGLDRAVSRRRHAPANEVLRFAAQVDVVWEQEVVLPVDDLRVCVVRRF